MGGLGRHSNTRLTCKSLVPRTFPHPHHHHHQAYLHVSLDHPDHNPAAATGAATDRLPRSPSPPPLARGPAGLLQRGAAVWRVNSALNKQVRGR